METLSENCRLLSLNICHNNMRTFFEERKTKKGKTPRGMAVALVIEQFYLHLNAMLEKGDIQCLNMEHMHLGVQCPDDPKDSGYVLLENLVPGLLASMSLTSLHLSHNNFSPEAVGLLRWFMSLNEATDEPIKKRPVN